MGGITEIATSAPGLQLAAPEEQGAAGRDAQAQRLRDRPVRQVPRGAGLGDEPDGPVRPLAEPGQRVRALLRLHRRRDEPVRAGDLPATPCRSSRTGRAEEGYHFTEDMTDQAIEWIRQQKALMPDKPFFIYYAPGATHAPHHVPTEWSDKYKGTFDDGWDALRERTFARQKELGVIPADAELTARPDEIPAWDDMPDDLKPVLARQMEVYAGFMEHTDHHVGRLIDSLADLEILDDTLIYAIIGDNGASAEGTPHGTLQRAARPQRRGRARDDRVHGRRRSTSSGRPRPTTTTPSAGPTRWTRPTSGPSRSPRTGAARATARSSTGRTASRRRARSATSSTTSSTSRRRSSRSPGCRRRPSSTASSRRRSRASRWPTRSTTPTPPTGTRPSTSRCSSTAASTTRAGPRSRATACRGSRPSCRRRSTTTSGSCTGRTTGPRPTTWPPSSPTSCADLQRLFLIEAGKYNVLPLDDRRVERFNADMAGRPQLIRGNRQILFGGMGRLSENSRPRHQEQVARDHRRGRRPGRRRRRASSSPRAVRSAAGRSTLTRAGRPTATTCSGCGSSRSTATTRCPPGEHQVRVEFAYDGGGLARAAPRRSSSTAPRSARAASTQPVPMVFSADETTDVGSDTGTPVTDDIARRRHRVQRPDQLGPDRHRRGRRGPRPPDLGRGALSGGDGPPVARGSASGAASGGGR